MTDHIEAEMAVLGAMVLSGAACREARAIVGEEHFYLPAHQVIFRALVHLQNGGFEVDLVSLKGRLIQTRELGAAGGVEYLVQCGEAVVTAAHAGTYARIVREQWLRRVVADRMQGLAGDLAALSTDEIVERTGMLTKGLGPLRTRAILGSEIDVDDVDLRGVRTPILKLNRAVEDCGGLPRGQITGVVATKKGGKTATMTDWAWHVTTDIAEAKPWVRGRRVAYVTVADLSPRMLKLRMIRQFSGLRGKPKPEGRLDFDDAMREWTEATSRNEWRRIEFYDGALGRGDARQICAWLEAEHERDPWEAVFVDYYQKLRCGQPDRVRDLEAVSGECAACAARMDSPAFVLGSQISKDGMTRYSQELENDAGLVVRISRDEGEAAASTCEVAYSRFGPACHLPLEWDERRLRFREPG